MLRQVPFALALAVLLASPLPAQVHPAFERGYDPAKSFPSAELDAVNLFNGNLTFQVPLASFPLPGGFGYGITLVYNSNVWDFEEFLSQGEYVASAHVSPGTNAGLGFRLHFGRLLPPRSLDDSFENLSEHWIYEGPDGSRHAFASRLHAGELSGNGFFYTRDGSYLRLEVVSDSVQKVQMPDGTVHTVTRIEIPHPSIPDWTLHPHRVTRMEDPHGNWATIFYNATDRTWVIDDSLGRQHRVIRSPITAGLPPMVTRLETEAFGDTTATWTFGYVNDQLPAPCQDSDPATTHVPVPLLTSLTGPEGLVYSMPRSGYARAVCGQGASGPLERLDLPTGGSIRWSYTLYPLGGTAAEGSKPRLHLRSSTGVALRRLFDGSTLVGSWSYAPEIDYPVGGYPTTELPKERTTTVVDPLGHTRVHYFSAALNLDGAWHPDDYSLPFTRDEADGTRLLSRKVLDTTGASLRSVYVRYEADPPDLLTGTPSSGDLNRRLVSTKTVYHDDADRWASVDLSDFDGLGHYRTRTTGGNFGAGDVRTVRTDHNPARGTYPGSFNMLPESAPWILNTYSEDRVTERGQTFVREACFDEATGKLLRERLRAGAGRGNHDVVRRFTFDAQGQRTREEHFGGDLQQVSTAALCGMGLTDPRYRLDHTYQHGVLATSAWVDAAGDSLPWKAVDRTIDESTGLIASSRDTAGFQTTYSWDGLGRLTGITPAEGASTVTTYTAASGSSPAKVRVEQKSGAAVLTEEEALFDPFGRLETERRRMPDGTWSARTTSHDALGNVAYRTEWDSTSSTKFQAYDPFGRPGEIVPPEGGQNKVTVWYAGVRSKTTLSKRATGRDAATGQILQTNVQHTETFDSQGRLWKVAEPEWPAGSGVRPETVYSYDAASRLVRLQMGGNATLEPPPDGPDSIFEDGFETGDFGCWSAVVGGAPGTPSTGCFSGSSSSASSGLVAATTETPDDPAEATVTQVRTFGYDGRGFLLQETHPELGTAINYSRYDPLGKPGRTTRGGWTLDATYDRAGRQLEIREPTGPGTSRLWKNWTYSDANFAGHGAWSRGKLATATRHNWIVPPGGSSPIDLAVTEDYRYLGLGGRISQVVTDLNTSGYRYVTNYGHDQLGDISSITYPRCIHTTCSSTAGLPRTVSFTRTRGMLTAVPGFASSISYHGNAMFHQIDHTNGVTDTQTVDPSGRARPGSISTSGASANWSSGTYAFDGSGNVVRIGNDWYLYDPLNRLSESSQLTPADTRRQLFEMDRFGNLLAITTNGTPRTHATDSSTNRLTSAAYDLSGNVVSWAGQSFEHDPFNMVSTSGDLLYVYGPGDERIWTIHAPSQDASTWTETWTLRGLGGQFLREYQVVGGNSEGNWSWTEDTIHLDGLVLAVATPSEVRHASLDHLGSPRLWTGAGGAVRSRPVHLPYGETAVASTETLQFTGHERDTREAGVTDDLDYMHARYYSPHLGRFLSVDPLGGQQRNPQSFNLFGYAYGNPLNFIDPDGRQPLEGYGYAEGVFAAQRGRGWTSYTAGYLSFLLFGDFLRTPSSVSEPGAAQSSLIVDRTEPSECTRSYGVVLDTVAGAIEDVGPVTVSASVPLWPLPGLAGAGLSASLTARPDGSADLYIGVGGIVGSSARASAPSFGGTVFSRSTGSQPSGWGVRAAGAVGLLNPLGLPVGLRGSAFISPTGRSASAGAGVVGGSSGSVTYGRYFSLLEPQSEACP